MKTRRDPVTEEEEVLLRVLRDKIAIEKKCDALNREGEVIDTCSVREFVLANGAFWAPRKDVAPCGSLKQCFSNAQQYARTHSNVWYVEGFATGASGSPTEHAWCIDDDGAVIDVTPGWQRDAVAYFGVVLPMELVDEHTGGNEEECSVIDNWEKNWPLLRLIDGRFSGCDAGVN